MANSKYEYVKDFEQNDFLLPNTWIVVRIDGRGFHKFSDRYNFTKPNDERALRLMNMAAVAVMRDLPDLIMAYGSSDEFSFVFYRHCKLFDRRCSKLVTTVVSTFTAQYLFHWPSFFPSTPLEPTLLPSFDGRAVQYPSIVNLRDYMSWRQTDCHVNNLYNTTFWNMVLKGGMSNRDAERELQGTVSSDKNEILFSRFGINYNNEPEMYKKGSVVFREFELQPSPAARRPESGAPAGNMTEIDTGVPEELSKSQADKQRKLRNKAQIVIEHIDIIKDDFWLRRPWILSNKPGKLSEKT